jgi:hypothetical protein
MATKILKWLAVVAFLATAAMIAVRVFGAMAGYRWVVHQITNATGLDQALARPIALAVLGILSLVPGKLIFAVLFNPASHRLVWACLLLVGAAGIGTKEYLAQQRHFSPSGWRYYLPTSNGCRFSPSPGTDGETGLSWLPLTPQVKHNCDIWKEHLAEIQRRSKKFNIITSEPNVFENPRTCANFDMPGVDPDTGEPLVPAGDPRLEHCKAQAEVAEQGRINDEKRRMADEAERHRAEERNARKAERKRKVAEAQRQAEERRRKRQEERRTKAEQIRHLALLGRYRYFGIRASETLDGYRFELRGFDVLAEVIRCHLGVTNLSLASGQASGDGSEQPIQPSEHRSVSFSYSVIDTSGTTTRAYVIRRVAGPIVDSEGGTTLPPPNADARLYIDFQRRSSVGISCVSINGACVFQPPRYIATFQAF